jgi:succinoglycan biosynthesis transport protein ExoP
MPHSNRFSPWLSGAALAPLVQNKNWRLAVFGAVFLFTAIVGLIVNYSRTAEYRAGARVEIVPAEKIPGEPGAPVVVNSGPNAPFLTEIQLLTERAALEKVAARIPPAGFGDAITGRDPVAELQKMISTEPVSGTQVAQLWAVGAKPEMLPFVLNELITIYQTQLGERFVDSSTDALKQAREETAKYKAAIAQQRSELEAFRLKHGIISKERDENEATARVRGLNTAINTAEEKAVAAQSRLNSLRAAINAGKATIRAKDSPTLAALEQRLSQAREELKQLERRYTPAYLVREPQAVALKTKIPELEDQIRREREGSQQANLADAEQEAAQTQEALASMRRQLAGDRSSVQSFTARLGEYNALQSQLESLEKLHDGAAERLVKIEARENARKPKLRVIQAAGVPSEPWRPNYHRDALIVLAASLILGWLAAWLADFLVRRETGPTVIVAPTPVPYPIGITEVAHQPTQVLGAAASAAQLPAPRHLPRELEQAELTAMLECADLETNIALSALLCGVGPEELLALTWKDVDGNANTIRIAQPTPRSIQIGPEIGSLWKALRRQKSGAPEDNLIGEAGAAPLSLSHLEALISYAAHDAALQQPADVTPWAVRHTFISYLVRQGVRFSEIARIVGTLPAEVTAAYGLMQPAGARSSIEAADKVVPALRQFAQAVEPEAAPNP